MAMKMMVVAALGLMALAGCSGGGHQEEVLADNVEEANVVMSDANLTAPPPVENVTNTAERAAPPPAFTDDQQMRDDADASGLTARIPDEEVQPGQGGNEVRPAE